jgi:CheY-like chemotaxis protein/anti-sigma regulatory factor (Ser/Thr protein kinase)
MHGSKLEAIGQLTGGIAHDFNNMLSVVMGSLDLLRNTLGDNALAHKRVRMALEGAQRCADLTNRLLSFARRQPLRASVVDLEAFGRDLVEILRRTLGDNIDLRLEAAEGLWPVQADPSQLEAALVNLAVNSRDAMPDGGRITIEMRNVAGGEVGMPAGLDGDAVLIRVADTGFGMTPEVRDRVFEPFFTTKEMGRGTGLGLSMTYGFVKQSGGEIEIRSAPAQGTTVSLFLPRIRNDTDSLLTADTPQGAPEGNGEIILVVEDDEEVRNVVLSTLQMLGYGTLAAENGEAAVAMLKRHSNVRLVLSDVNMPGGLNGFALAREVQARWRNVKFLLTSGFVNDREGDESVSDVLLKPYRADELARRVRDVLDEDSQPRLAISA